MPAIKSVFVMILLACTISCSAQQVADTAYRAPRFTPRYSTSNGPQVWIDEAHYNFHTADGRYRPFAQLLTSDGYRIERNTGSFTPELLRGKKVLVISNAVHHSNADNWDLPNYSAFTEEEITALRTWVEAGGSLFLIADHMPFAGAAKDLAAAFGFTCYNGFAMDSVNRGRGAELFIRQTGGFSPGPLADLTSVDTVASFTGQAFDIPKGASSILNFNSSYAVLMPKRAWEFNRNTPRVSAAGKSGGAILQFGKGRVAMWGEAAMFSAQSVDGVAAAGMNTPDGRNNYRLLLSLMHWLDSEQG